MRARTDVVVEARRDAAGPVMASYRMGSATRLGAFYDALRIAQPAVGHEQLRTGLPSRTIISWVDPALPLLTTGPSVGPGTVIESGQHSHFGNAIRLRLH